MKLSELIKELYAAQREHGDVEVRTLTHEGGYRPVVAVERPLMDFDHGNYLVFASNPNWPSKTGEPSGGGRGNA